MKNQSDCDSTDSADLSDSQIKRDLLISSRLVRLSEHLKNLLLFLFYLAMFYLGFYLDQHGWADLTNLF